jgi:hypothetical protein
VKDALIFCGSVFASLCFVAWCFAWLVVLPTLGLLWLFGVIA